MSEVLDIEVDGEIEPSVTGPTGGSAKWGLPVAIALAGSLLLAVMVLVLLPALTAGKGTRTSLSPGASPPTLPMPEPAPTTAPLDPRVATAQAALAAWGEFVAEGDVELLAPWFAEDGPQYLQLAEEASELALEPGESYTVATKGEAVTSAGETEAVVASSVIWTQPDGNIQRFEWDVVLRRAEDGRWLLWTVRSRES